MQNEEVSVEVLNDLVKVNNDRIAGYERAINEAKDLDVDLKATFEGMIRESEQYKQELVSKVQECGGEVEEGTTTSGQIYRAWMDVKAKFTEDAALRAYEAALSAEASLSPEIRSVIQEQHQSLRSSHDLIKKYRDAHNLGK